MYTWKNWKENFKNYTMIKKLLFTFAFAGGILGATAQCTPDASNTDLISVPDGSQVVGTTTYFPPITQGEIYDEVVQIYIPASVELDGFGTVQVANLTLDDIEGLPEGLSYDCDNADCHWEADSNGCVTISGTVPTSVEDGEFVLTLVMSGTAMVGTLEVPVPASSMAQIIDSSGDYAVFTGSDAGLSTPELNAQSFNLKGNVPNPFQTTTTIRFSNAGNEIVNLHVYDLLGNVVSTQQVETIAGENAIRFEANALSSGIYMYSLDNGVDVLTGRMIIKN